MERFLSAQENTYNIALNEIKSSKKQSHWMWFIFPQLKGLGFSSTSKFYAISDLKEAEAYLNHPILGNRLIEITEVLLKLENKSAHEIFGSPDDKKLLSCVSLFSMVDNSPSVFHEVLNKYFNGKLDKRTLQLLSKL